MTTAAVIDVGSNATRLLVVGIDAIGREVTRVYKRWPIRLGPDVFASGRIAQNTVEELVGAFGEIRSMIEETGATRQRAVATASFREANNGKEVAALIAEKTGIQLEIISGIEEAELSRMALLNAVGGSSSGLVLTDLGGGSLEVARADRRHSVSAPIGTLRLLEACPELKEPCGERVLDEARLHIAEAVSQLSGFRASISASTGGNLAVLAELFPSEDAVLPAIDLEAMSQGLGGIAAMTLDERVARLGIRKDRADTILSAGLIMSVFAEKFSIKRVLVPGVGLREGLIASLLNDVPKLDLPMSESNQQTPAMRSCLKLARGIIDATRPVHGLWPAAINPIRAAAHFASLGAQLDQESPAAHALYLLENSKSRALADGIRKVAGTMLRAELAESDVGSGRDEHRDAALLLSAISALAVQLTERGIKSVPRFDLTSHAIKLSLPRGGSLDPSSLDVFSGALQRAVELAD